MNPTCDSKNLQITFYTFCVLIVYTLITHEGSALTLTRGAGRLQQNHSAVLYFPGCTAAAVADLVFLVDGSWSVGRQNFRYIRNFIAAAAGAFQIGEDRTRVSVVQFSDDTQTQISLNQYPTRAGLLRAIGSLTYKGGNTKTGLYSC